MTEAKEVMAICLYSQGCGSHLSAFIAHEASEEQTYRVLGVNIPEPCRTVVCLSGLPRVRRKSGCLSHGLFWKVALGRYFVQSYPPDMSSFRVELQVGNVRGLRSRRGVLYP